MSKPYSNYVSQNKLQETAGPCLKLSNHVVNGKLENLCYINSCINVLYRCVEFSSFFQQQEYLQSGEVLENYPVSAELTNLFISQTSVNSAANLRHIIAEMTGKFNYCEQQDITEFYSILFQVLTAEFETNHCNTGLHLLNQFVGLEKIDFQFANICHDCQYNPEDNYPEFNILSLSVQSCISGATLSELVNQHYQNIEIREMKCQCPGSANKTVRVSTSLIKAPEHLMIELRRYRATAGYQLKSGKLVMLDDTLILPSGEEYKLKAVADHRGASIQSGHYVSLANLENGKWLLINDDKVTELHNSCISSPDNLLIFYSKSENKKTDIDDIFKDLDLDCLAVRDKPSRENRKRENSEDLSDKTRQNRDKRLKENPEDSDVDCFDETEKIPCLSCGKKVKHIFRHIKDNKKCGEKYDFESEKKKFNAYMRENSRQRRDKRKRENSEDVSEKNKAQCKLRRERRKIEDPEELSEKEKAQRKLSRERRKIEDPVKLSEKEKAQSKQSRDRKKIEDPEDLKEKEKSRQAKSKVNKLSTEEGQIAAFHRSVRYGPIFVCISCHRKMFEDQVVKYAGKVKAKIESYKGLYERTIKNVDQIPNIFDGVYYLCKTCQRSLYQGKMPGICHSNKNEMKHVGQIINIRDDDGKKIGEYTLTQEDIDNTDLTDLEQSLIARSLIFMKIHKLPKSQMSAVKDRMVYVPIPPDHTLNTMDTVLRTPSEAGIIPVKVKRKMEYKHSYMEEYVSIPKLIASLRLLLKIRHPEYRFLTEEMIQDYEARLQKEADSEDKE